MSPEPIRRIVIAGLGLIGGSIAKTVRRRLPEAAIAAWDDESVIQDGLRQGVIDASCRPEDLRHGDLLVLAAPPVGSLYILDSLPELPSGVIVTTASKAFPWKSPANFRTRLSLSLVTSVTFMGSG